MIRVLAITTWQTACGIAEYAGMLDEALREINAKVELIPCPEGLDPAAIPFGVGHDFAACDLVWLNYHAGLHSRWGVEEVARLRQQIPVVVTYHDTYDGVESINMNRPKALAKIANAFIVHEPVADIPEATYLRQGIPRYNGTRYFVGSSHLPILGTAGFPFPWKNYDRLCEITAELGWRILLIAPTATEDQVTRWKTLNPHAQIVTEFLPRQEVIAALHACDATAWMYECHNTGTSAAIRLGIAALKPVIALASCRQFRDLKMAESEWYPLIRWVHDWQGLRGALLSTWSWRVDPRMVYLAKRDSWTGLAERYEEIVEQAAGRRGRS